MSLSNGAGKLDSISSAAAVGQLIIKASVGDDIRRIPIHNDDLTYDELILMMQRVFKGVLKTDEDLVLKYKDEDGDLVSLTDTNDLSYAIQYSRVLRLTILQSEGQKCEVTNTFDKEVVKELRQIRDRVNALLDMVVTGNEEKIEKDSGISGNDSFNKTFGETVSQVQNLNLEQNKEFDPLEQEQTISASVEKTRQMSGQSSVSSASVPSQPQQQQYQQQQQQQQTQQYPPQQQQQSSYPGYPGPTPSYPSYTGASAAYPPAPSTTTAATSYTGAATSSTGYTAPGSGATSAAPTSGYPGSQQSVPPPSGPPTSFPSSQPSSAAPPSSYPGGPPSSTPGPTYPGYQTPGQQGQTSSGGYQGATSSYGGSSSASTSSYPGPPSATTPGTYQGYPPQHPPSSYQPPTPGQAPGGFYGGGAQAGAGNPYSRSGPPQNQPYPRPPQ